MMRRSVLAVIACMGLMASAATGKPNFTGTWKLVADKSDFGPMPVPEKYEQAVNHADPDLRIKVTQVSGQGEVSQELTYNTEGKETTNSFRGAPMKSTAKWDGDNLTIESKIDFQGNEITIKDKWALDENGKVVVVTRNLNSPQGELEMKIVLEKQ